ncbi:MAG TPA: hypothetical protein VHY22_10235, partial [Chthoniobacteraceae bacterium]|nr:hypothetical protein [Chthoniobacteraceae bacterium]
MIELLESRIAPASLVSYMDVDGDKVTISVSKGTISMSDLTLSGGTSGILETLNLTDAGFNGANVTFHVAKGSHGNGLANVGVINAGTNDLGAVTVAGDLGSINAGNDSATVPAIASLTVNSMGVQSLTSGSSLTSAINGALGKLTVKHDATNVFIDDSGANAGIGTVKIGGSLSSVSDSGYGEVYSSGNIGSVLIGGNLQGGISSNSGIVYSGGAIGSVTVHGSLMGSQAEDTGAIFADGNIGPVLIGGSIYGGAGEYSGVIYSSAGAIASVNVGKSMTGGAGEYSGVIFTPMSIGPVTIKGNMTGGAGDYSGAIINGPVYSSGGVGNLGNVTIGGSVIGGAGYFSGVIYSNNNIGVINIAGDQIGGDGYCSALIYPYHGNLAALTIGGSVLGVGDGDYNAGVYVLGTAGPIVIKHSIIGGEGYSGGAFYAEDGFSTFKVGGDIVGGTGEFSAALDSGGQLPSLTVGGNFAGGYGEYSGNVYVYGEIGLVHIGGSFTGGDGEY